MDDIRSTIDTMIRGLEKEVKDLKKEAKRVPALEKENEALKREVERLELLQKGDAFEIAEIAGKALNRIQGITVKACNDKERCENEGHIWSWSEYDYVWERSKAGDFNERNPVAKLIEMARRFKRTVDSVKYKVSNLRNLLKLEKIKSKEDYKRQYDEDKLGNPYAHDLKKEKKSEAKADSITVISASSSENIVADDGELDMEGLFPDNEKSEEKTDEMSKV